MFYINVVIVNTDDRYNAYIQDVLQGVDGIILLDTINDKHSLQNEIEFLKPDLVIALSDSHDHELLRLLSLVKTNSYELNFDCIYLTKSSSTRDLEWAMSIGIYDYILMPFLKSRFMSSLRQYLTYKLGVKNSDRVKQNEIDALLNRSRISNQTNSYPSGIDKVTLERIRSAFKSKDITHTALSISKERNISKTTARRYLEFAVENGFLLADINYGNVGRPERLYKINPMS